MHFLVDVQRESDHGAGVLSHGDSAGPGSNRFVKNEQRRFVVAFEKLQINDIVDFLAGKIFILQIQFIGGQDGVFE